MSKQEVIAARSSYEHVLNTYEAFRSDHADVIDEHDHLAVQLSEELERLKSVLRENEAVIGGTYGEFKISVPRKYDVEALKNLLGSEATFFIKTKETVDSDMFEKAVKNATVSQDVYDAVVGKDTPRIIGGPKVPTIFQR